MKSPFKIFVVIAAVIVLLWLVNVGLLWTYEPDWPTRGQVGDSFGSINALFSGLALAAIIVTIWTQRQELALQREELGLQREEMAKSREEIATQVRIQRAALMASLTQARLMAMEAEVRAEEIVLTAAQAGRSASAQNEYKIAVDRYAQRMHEQVRWLEENIGGISKRVELDGR